jgi:predicted RNA-binding Zn-ribbon protein involved in translation (DUF1610 family)
MARTTSRMGQPWKYVIVDDKPKPFACPECGTEIRHIPARSDVVHDHQRECHLSYATTCEQCGWIPADMTPEQRAALLTDPELLPAKEYMKRIEQKDNPKKINGKTKRDKKFLSKACY